MPRRTQASTPRRTGLDVASWPRAGGLDVCLDGGLDASIKGSGKRWHILLQYLERRSISNTAVYCQYLESWLGAGLGARLGRANIDSILREFILGGWCQTIDFEARCWLAMARNGAKSPKPARICSYLLVTAQMRAWEDLSSQPRIK